MHELSDQDFRDLAREQHLVEGICEIDADAVVCRADRDCDGSDEGAYIQAWVWVPVHSNNPPDRNSLSQSIAQAIV